MSKYLYHGTSESAAQNIITNGVILTIGRKNIDFGQGFYLAQIRGTAITWATRQGRRYHENGVVLYFSLNSDGLNVKFFKANGEWVDEIICQRTQCKNDDVADIIIGPIADGTDIMENIKLYQRGKIDLKNILSKLTVSNYGLQFVIKTEKAKDKLIYHKKEVVYYD